MENKVLGLKFDLNKKLNFIKEGDLDSLYSTIKEYNGELVKLYLDNFILGFIHEKNQVIHLDINETCGGLIYNIKLVLEVVHEKRGPVQGYFINISMFNRYNDKILRTLLDERLCEVILGKINEYISEENLNLIRKIK